MSSCWLAAGADPASASPGPATNDEYAILVLTNELRADPSAQGYPNSVAPPLLWNDGLGRAAREHSDDMATHGCFSHSSCGGGSWSARISKYYSGWEWIGENIAGVATTPEQFYSIWVSSPGHRGNMLNPTFNDFGAGIAIASDGTGSGTEDFGARALRSLNSIPAIPAATVLPRVGGGGEARELLANYYHYNGKAPKAVRALAGSSCISLSRVSGTSTYGTYAATRSIPDRGCVPVVFEAIRSDGQHARFPASDALVAGVGSSGANCPQRTSTLPSAVCGDGPLPTPTPGPASGSTVLGKAQVVIMPGKVAGKDRLRLSGVIEPGSAFAPDENGVQIAIQYPGGSWSIDLPAQCGNQPCLKVNSRGTSFRSHYASNLPKVSLVVDHTRTRWTLRASAISLALVRPSAGTVGVIATAGGHTSGASIAGVWRRTSYVAK